MECAGKKIGFCLTSSYYAIKSSIEEIKKLIKKGADIIPIMSFDVYYNDSRFGKAKDFIKEIEKITNKRIIYNIQEAEYLYEKQELDIMIIAPCSGNTIAKLASSIADTPVLVAVRSHLKDSKPLVIGICCKDALSYNAENIGKLLNRKDLFFVPFRQDNPITKPYSISYQPLLIRKTLENALDRIQIQPLIL